MESAMKVEVKNLSATLSKGSTVPEFEAIAVEMNGNFEVGIGAGSDASYDPESFLEVHDQDFYTALAALRICGKKRIAKEALQALVISAAIVCAKSGLITAKCNAKKAIVKPNISALSDEEAGVMKLVTPKIVQMAATAIVATKVNFFQTNHHTGQGVITGYAAKVAKAMFPDETPNDLTTPFWIIGHWADTLLVWGSLGIPKCAPAAKFVVNPSSDVMIRIRTLPAGCAKLGFLIAALQKFAIGMIPKFVTFPFDLEQYVEMYKAILEDPVKYHVGANGLGHVDKFIPIAIDDELLQCLSAFIHIIHPGSTLSKSKACIKAAELSNHPWMSVLPVVRDTLKAYLKFDDEKLKAAVDDLLNPTTNESKIKSAATQLIAINAKIASDVAKPPE